MRFDLLFPVLLTLMELGASAVYFVRADVRLGLYWLLCAGITVVITKW